MYKKFLYLILFFVMLFLPIKIFALECQYHISAGGGSYFRYKIVYSSSTKTFNRYTDSGTSSEFYKFIELNDGNISNVQEFHVKNVSEIPTGNAGTFSGTLGNEYLNKFDYNYNVLYNTNGDTEGCSSCGSIEIFLDKAAQNLCPDLYYGDNGLSFNKNDVGSSVQTLKSVTNSSSSSGKPQLPTKCEYTAHNDIIDSGIYGDPHIVLTMEATGQKYVEVYLKFDNAGDEEVFSGSAQIGTGDVSFDLTVNFGTRYDVYHFTLKKEEINKLFSQAEAQKANNTFSCISQVFINGCDHNNLEISTVSGSCSYQGTGGGSSSGSPTSGTTGTGHGLNYSSLCGDNPGVRSAAKIIGYIIVIGKWVVAFIIIIFGIIDFSKAALSSDEKALNKATNSLVKRFIAGVIAIVIPTLPIVILNIIEVSNNIENSTDFAACTKCIFDPFNSCD